MSIDPAGSAPRASNFATIKAAFKHQARDLARAHRRAAAIQPPKLHRDAPCGALHAGIVPLRLLQAVLDRADVIALDKPKRGKVRQVHLLLTVPVTLLDRATSIAAYDADDEDTDAEPEDTDEDTGELEWSLAIPDAIVDQSRKFPLVIGVDGSWQHAEQDLELDPAEREPSLGSLDGEVNQERWAAGDRLDRERGPGDGDSDDDEDSHDRESDTSDFEPEHEEPSLSPCGFNTVGSSQNYGGAIDGEEDGYGKSDPRDAAIRAALKVHASVPVPQPALAAAEPEPGAPELWFPTGNRPGGRLEMKNQATGETGVWMLLTRDGEAL